MKALRTTALALCLASCMRLVLRDTPLERQLTVRRRLVALHVQPPRLGHTSHDVANGRRNNTLLEDKAQFKPQALDRGALHEPEGHQGMVRKDNALQEKCPHQDSKLERYKCFLPSEMTEKGGAFDVHLKQRADGDKIIFLVSVDNGYVDVAINLHRTSFRALNIANYLFVCSDSEAAAALDAAGIDCYVFKQNIPHQKASKYMSKNFVLKTHVKTKVILSGLYLHYSIIITDADIVFLQNPQSHLNCSDCDIEIQSDHSELNSGFYMARPTEGTVLLHQMMMDKGVKSNTTSNQKALNRALRTLKSKKLIKVRQLDKFRFPCGLYYFEKFKRMWSGDNICKDCVIVHNNWIMGKEAKIYRFKDHLMWHVNNDGYYNDPTRKYIVYSNPRDWENNTSDIEVATLKIALQIGFVLNRTVILPSFTCRGCSTGACRTPSKRCSMNVHLRISVFDQTFSGLYREHLFLSHPSVPNSVKTSVSPVVHLNGISSKDKNTENRVFKPQDPENGASAEELLQWLGPDTTLDKFSVLQFRSLYNSLQSLDSHDPKYSRITDKINKGFKRAAYRQY